MAFSDSVIILVVLFGLIVSVFVMTTIINNVYTGMDTSIPNSTNQTVMQAWNNTVTFYDSSFVFIFIMMMLISLAFSVFVSSHPIIMLVWLIFNMFVMVIYDVVIDVLNSIVGGRLDTGNMNNAISFFKGPLPKLLIVMNMFVPIILLGKRSLYG